jgi:hypothetical protein
VQPQVFGKGTDYLFPFKPPGIFLEKPVVKHQQGAIMFPVCPHQRGKKIVGQCGEQAGTGRHEDTLGKGRGFVKAEGKKPRINA